MKSRLMLCLCGALWAAVLLFAPGPEAQAASSPAHQQSRSAILDPFYSADREWPKADVKAGTPWIYGDSELECWLLHRMRQRSTQVCKHVGYPGVFHEPFSKAYFRLAVPAAEWSTRAFRVRAVGQVSLFVDGQEIAPAKEGVYKLPPATSERSCELRFELSTTNGEPPALLIENGPCATSRAGWEWSPDGKVWSVAQTFSQTRSGVPPHLAEQPVLELEPTSQHHRVIDFGRTILARIQFRCSNTPKLMVGESIQEALKATDATAEQSMELERGKDDLWISKYPLAFRYARISGGQVSKIKALAVVHPVRYRGAFACSSPRLTQIWMNSAYTLRLCMNDLVIDGVKRDRLPWVGDEALSLSVNAYTFADAEIFRRSFAALGRAGISQSDLNGIVDYSLWWVINQDRFQLFFENRDYLRYEWPRVKDLLQQMEARCDQAGYLVPRPGAWLFIDWDAPNNKERINVSLQTLWYWALQSGANIASRMGDGDTAAKWQDRAGSLASLLRREAWDESARGWRLYAGVSGELSRHANFLAVLSGLATRDQYPGIRQHLLARQLPPASTPFMTAFEMMALARLGESAAVIQRIESYWGAMLDRGATTFWESYNPAKPDDFYAMYGRPFANSFCHAWSSGPAAVLPAEILGIRPLEDGWRRFSVDPHLGPLSWASATVPTPHGEIKLDVQPDGTTLTIPPGTTAQWQGRSYPGPDVIKTSVGH